MAKKKLVQRMYAFSDNILTEIAGKIYRAASIDILKFNTYGVSDIDLENFKNQREAFRDDPGDIDAMSNWLITNEDKDILAENVLGKLRRIRTMVGNKWGDNDARYRGYRFENMSVISDEKLHRLARRAVKRATVQLLDLESEGLTQDIIDDLEDTNNTFDDSIDIKEEAEIDRDIATQTRVEAGNSLFKELMKLGKIGQNIFANSDALRTKLYTVYGPKNAKPKRKKKAEAEDGEEVAEK